MQKSIPQLFDLTGKTAIVTGGAMGIGYGIALRLLEAGARVVIADIDEKAGTGKAQILGEKSFFKKTDVSSEDSVKNLFAYTIEKFGKLDILVNNAGIFPQSPVLDMELELWKKIQAVNLRSMFLCCREAGKFMAQAGQGVIVNIGSIDSLHPSNVGLAAYDASKHGAWGFTKNFALEVAPKKVRVNMIAPGGVATEGVAKLMNKAGADPKEIKKNMDLASSVPLGEIADPDDIAKVVLFLASEASSHMTGSIVVVDGGTLLTIK